MRTRAHPSRAEKIAVQECRDFANRSSEVKKTLEPCGFLHCSGIRKSHTRFRAQHAPARRDAIVIT